MSPSIVVIAVIAVFAAIALFEVVASRRRRRDRTRDLESHKRSIVSLCHELRTPLNAMAGSLSVLQSRSLDVRQHAIEVIERNVRIEADLIDQLLSESRHLSRPAAEAGPNSVGQTPDAPLAPPER